VEYAREQQEGRFCQEGEHGVQAGPPGLDAVFPGVVEGRREDQDGGELEGEQTRTK